VEETIAIAVVAPGYKAHVLGTVTSFDELSNFSTLQEGVSSTSLMLAPMSCSC